MIQIDTSKWEAVGETANTRYFVIKEGVLGAVPHPRSTDNLTTARENMAFQNEYFKKRGEPGVVVIFFDALVEQDKDARRVYQTDGDDKLVLASLLVGGTLLSRAMGSFFLGLAKPRIPVKLFKGLDEALAWAEQLMSTQKRAS
jgi:hypothetical protein